MDHSEHEREELVRVTQHIPGATAAWSREQAAELRARGLTAAGAARPVFRVYNLGNPAQQKD